MKTAAVLLSGCGVYDGSEIHETVLAILHLKKQGFNVQYFAPNKPQYHVINHLTGQEMPQERNMLEEAARIARGDIKDLKNISVKDFDTLVLPGGFGVAKNFTTWAFKGKDSNIEEDIKNTILETLKAKKPILAMCMAPVVVAKAVENTPTKINITVGSTNSPSPYNIQEIGQNIEATGNTFTNCEADDYLVDIHNLIVTTPCYMMETDILTINEGIKKAVKQLKKLLSQ